MKKKALLSSILTIALCLSMIAGSSFALFTSESKVNVAVTSGTVDVVATASEPEYTSTLENGKLDDSTATQDGNTITITKMVPGDVVTFTITIENNSDVTVKYRTIIKKLTDDGLWSGLEVTIGGTEYTGTTKITPWDVMAPASESTTVDVTVALPEGAGKEYQAKSCSFSYTVEAVQGNATVTDPEVTEGQDAVNAALTAAGTEPVNLYLEAGNYTLPAVAGKTVTISGDKNAVIDMATSGMTSAGVGTAGLTIAFEGVTVKFANEDYKGIQHTTKVTYKNCVLYGKQFMYAEDVEFINCTFINDADYAVWTYGAKNAKYDGCTFYSGGKAILIYQEWDGNGTAPSNNVIVTNCTFYDNGNLDTVKAAIEIGDSQNTAGLTVKLTATNNKIYGFANNDEGTATGNKMWGNKNSMPADRLTVTASNNTEYDATVALTGNADVVTKALKQNTKTIDITLTGDVEIAADSGTQYANASGGVDTETVTIDGQGKYTLTFKHPDSDANHVATSGAALVLRNLKLSNSGYNDGPWNRHDIVFDCKVTLENVYSDKAIALGADATMKNVTIADEIDDSVYALWIMAKGQNVSLENLTILNVATDTRAIAIKEEYVATPASVTLTIKNSTIASQSKAAILVTSRAGATITVDNVDITGVVKDTTNIAWKDNGSYTVEGTTHYYKDAVVNITGGTCITESF